MSSEPAPTAIVKANCTLSLVFTSFYIVAASLMIVVAFVLGGFSLVAQISVCIIASLILLVSLTHLLWGLSSSRKLGTCLCV